MNDYKEVRFNVEPPSEDACDLLAAALAEEGYESFVTAEDAATLTAYVRAEDFNADAVSRAIAESGAGSTFLWDADTIEGQDWNSEWEKNYFKPIVIADRCVVHSSFHTDVPHAEYDIVIDPKMAFGTGHHATTSQVIEAIFESGIAGKAVLDMGTGSGILAILCAKLGASRVEAVEIDGFAYANALENLALNGCSATVVAHNGDASVLELMPAASVDVFIANINRNIIIGDIEAYSRVLRPGGVMLLSGFYESDIPVVAEAAATCGLVETSHSTGVDAWCCLRLRKND